MFTAPERSAAAIATGPRKKKLRLAERTGVNTAPIVGKQQTDSKKPVAPAGAADGKPRGRQWTVSVALPGSIVDNAQTNELRSQLVGQVARACAIFNVDEIIVFTPSEDGPPPISGVGGEREERHAKRTDGAIFMARLLQYLECPQYLRKHIFPVHNDLRHVGLLAPLDAPHHLRIEEACEYREAVVVAPGASAGGGKGGGADGGSGGADANGKGGGAGGEGDGGGEAGATSSTVYTGLRKELKIGHALPIGTRVTVRMPAAGSSNARAATVVPPREPRERLGMYWGYEVRLAKGLGAIWSECPYEGGYDTSLGTSEHGIAVAGLGGGGDAAAGESKNVGGSTSFGASPMAPFADVAKGTSAAGKVAVDQTCRPGSLDSHCAAVYEDDDCSDDGDADSQGHTYAGQPPGLCAAGRGASASTAADPIGASSSVASAAPHNEAYWQGYVRGHEDAARDIYTNADCLLYTSPSPRDRQKSRMPSSA